MPDKFPTTFYEENDYLVCPNGDKVRSDDEGLFCWIDGSRVGAIALNGVVTLQPVAVLEIVEPTPTPTPTKTPSPSKSKAKVDAKADPTVDVKVEQTDANG